MNYNNQVENEGNERRRCKQSGEVESVSDTTKIVNVHGKGRNWKGRISA